MSTSVLDNLLGQIRDSDSHEFVPAGLWPETFGDVTAPFAQIIQEQWDPDSSCSLSARVERDEAPVDEPAWQTGAKAPGAIDMTRRVEVLDTLGVAEAFIFGSGVASFGMLACTVGPDMFQELFNVHVAEAGLDFELDEDLLRMIGRGFLDAHNEWCIQTAKVSPRLRPVPFLDSRDLKDTIAEAERLIASGLRAIGLPSGSPPGGISPGHPDLDPLWEVLTANNVPLVLHLGGDFGFYTSGAWSNYGAGQNLPGKFKSPEVLLDPYSFSLASTGCQHFLTTMICGGVFDRHPALRVGCMEVGAYWIGPMIENLANVGAQFSAFRALQLTPAEYVQKHVRVTPYWWEPVDKYIERLGLDDVYVFGSDYPHFEGGHDPRNIYSTMLERLGPTVTEKFFVKNAALLMP